jgi:hypothetical protein
LRDLARGESLLLDAPQGGPGESGRAKFEYATADGGRVFFTDAQRLTSDSTAQNGEPDLYMCEVEILGGHLSCALTDLTVNTVAPEIPANVLGSVIGAAPDGSSLYFVANGALTSGAVNGDCAEGFHQPATNRCNLYRYDTESSRITLVAVLSGADTHSWQLGSGYDLQGLDARVSPNGRYLAFMSERPLTGYDNRDASSGERDEEVFLYDSQAEAGAGKLLCASCNPTGARPQGRQGPPNVPAALVDVLRHWEGRWYAANIPGWTGIELPHALYQSRYLSDSGRLFFNASDALVPADTNSTEDVYQFEPSGAGGCTEQSPGFASVSGGCVDLITSGTSPEESAFMDASESGNDVFFLTASRLTSRDEDTALDLYDARVGGGEPQSIKPVECSGDACQQPAVPPNDQTPGSLTFQGAGNLKECSKGKKLKKGKCVKQKSKKKKKHHKKKGHKKQKRANSSRGGRK